MFKHHFNYSKNGKIADFNTLKQNGYFYIKETKETVAVLNRYHDFMIGINDEGRYFKIDHVVYDEDQTLVSFNAVKLS